MDRPAGSGHGTVKQYVFVALLVRKCHSASILLSRAALTLSLAGARALRRCLW